MQDRSGLAGDLTVPWVSALLLCAFSGVWHLEEYAAGFYQPPTLDTLVAMGGLNRHLVLDAGEYWRVLTAPFMHASFQHLISNCLVFVFCCYRLERYVGHAWTLAIFFFGAIGGSVGSMLWTSAAVSVGASGAIMGMLAAQLAISFSGTMRNEAWRLRFIAARWLVLDVVPIFYASKVTRIDYGAHAGGALAGLLVGALIVAAWDQDEAMPSQRRLAGGFAVAATICALVAAYAVRQHLGTGRA